MTASTCGPKGVLRPIELLQQARRAGELAWGVPNLWLMLAGGRIPGFPCLLLCTEVCTPLKFVCWILTPKLIGLGDRAFWKWLGQEGRALMNGIGVLMEVIPESSLYLSHRGRLQLEAGIGGPESRLSPWISLNLVLGLPNLQNCEKYISVV